MGLRFTPGRGAMLTLGQLLSRPLPQRLEGQDTNPYYQPQPLEVQYQTFWQGNQLPGVHVQAGPHTQWIPVQAQDQRQPQRSELVAFGRTLGQSGSARVVSQWRDLWTRLGG